MTKLRNIWEVKLIELSDEVDLGVVTSESIKTILRFQNYIAGSM